MDLAKVYRNYLDRYANEFSFDRPIPDVNPELIVVIPCYDEGDITLVLKSLYDSYTFSPVVTQVIVVINAPEGADESICQNNALSLHSVQQFSGILGEGTGFDVFAIVNNAMPPKHAGVGLARKTGMDLVVSIFEKQNKEGVLVCLDADSLVALNYLATLKDYFEKNKRCDAVSIHFEHVLDVKRYGVDVIKTVVDYELHLRLFIHFQKWLGLPYAFQTIGSSMAVKASSYVLYGGMNKRKAGEDFYFLHKFGDKGKVCELKDTCVFPSPRISHRVPFGTGKAIGDALKEKKPVLTYNPITFEKLKPLITSLQLLYTKNWNIIKPGFDKDVISFFDDNDIEKALENCKQNSKDFAGFQKRFFQWFNAFKLMKYCHYLRDKGGLHDVKPTDAYAHILYLSNHTKGQETTTEAEKILFHLRNIDKNGDIIF